MEDIFAGVDKAIEAKYGDQAGDASGNGQAAPEVTDKAQDQAQAPGQESKGSSESQSQAIFDLSKAEKFILNGKETTLKELQAQIMMQQDYTRKSQEIAQDRKYRDNLEFDLAKIEKNPKLVSEFKKIYPKQYHRAADYAAHRMERQEQTQEQGTDTQSHLVKQIVEDAVGPIRSELDSYKTEAAVKQLDGIFAEMRSKFPDAKEKYALAELQALKDMEIPITQAKIEEVFKSLHEESKTLKESYHMEQLNKQKQANQKAKDAPSGGGIPGQAPKRYKNLEDLDSVQKDLIQHLSR